MSKSRIDQKNTHPRSVGFHFRHLFTLGAVIFCVALTTVTAAAQTCIPRAVGVPGQNSPPNWFDAGQPANSPTRFNTSLEDPRWRGAVNQTYGSGAAEQVAFRALHSTALGGGEFLYLSWNIKVSPSLAGTNQVYVGFSPGGGLDDVLIKVSLNGVAPGEATTQTNISISTKPAASMGNAYVGQATPAWLSGRTRAWVNNVPSNTWAIQMVVPISDGGLASGLNLSTPFRMWFEVNVADMGNFIFYRFPIPANPSDPDSQPQTVRVDGMGNDQFPETSTWGEFRLTNGTADSPDPNCPVDGVSLKVGDVGTQNNPTSQMNLVSPNVFEAKARNNTSNPIPAGQLLATFFMANWGTQILVDDPLAPGSAWQPILGLVDVPSQGVTGTGGAQANISQAKSFCAAVALPFQNGTKTKHQCIFVKLRATTTLKFTNDSVARNMDFVDASTFEREADVSVVGLRDMPGSPKRDVYLYVEAVNMPAVVKGGGNVPGVSRATTTGGQVPLGELHPTNPTYRVHAYHDTGKRITRNGVEFKLLSPQSSFGYYVNHSGPLEGWKHSLEGAQEIGPNLYLIAVPNNSAVKIKTIIEAIEPGSQTTGGFRRWGLSLHAGISFPQGNFNTVFDPGPNFGVDLEYRINKTFSVEGIYTFHRFRGDTIGPFTFPDQNLHQFSVNGKVYGNTSPVRPFFNFGGGAYKFDPGPTDGGLNVGGGLQFDITPNVAFDAMYNFHNVFTSGSSTKFSTVQGGVRFRF